MSIGILTVERTSPETGARVARSFTSVPKAEEFFRHCAERGQEPRYVATPEGVKAHLARIGSAVLKDQDEAVRS